MANGRVRSGALGMLGVLLWSCAGPPGDASSDVEGRASPIIGGELDTGDPAVVALARQSVLGLDTFCSGTLIGPSTVISAAHCVDLYGSDATYVAIFGNDVQSPTQTVEISEQVAHPDFDRAGQLENDVGLFRLRRPVLSISPVPLNTTPLTEADLGRDIRHVGFGVYELNVDGSSDFDGKKRMGRHAISNVFARVVESAAPSSQTCMGDSGGPGFLVTEGSAAERLAGLVSYGDARCARYGADTRVDVYFPWIEQTSIGWETPGCHRDGHCQSECPGLDLDCVCAADGTCGPDCPDAAQDPDCPSRCGGGNGCAAMTCAVPDPDCQPVGGACTTPGECQSRQCLSDPDRGGYCSATCVQNADCGQDMDCRDGLCTYPLQQAQVLPIEAAEVVGRAAAAGCVQGPLYPSAALSLLVALSLAVRVRRPRPWDRSSL